MSESSGRGEGNGGATNSWEQRAAGLASEVQRWLIRSSAKNVKNELGGQVRKALRGQEAEPGDVWGTATTEPPRAAGEAPECAWCPVCRAARRIAESKSAPSGGHGSVLADAADVMTAAVKEVFSGLDSVLSYRPGGQAESTARPPGGTAGPAGPADQAGPAGPVDEPAGDRPRGPEHGPDHRG
jgi:hypothetical protein